MTERAAYLFQQKVHVEKLNNLAYEHKIINKQVHCKVMICFLFNQAITVIQVMTASYFANIMGVVFNNISDIQMLPVIT